MTDKTQELMYQAYNRWQKNHWSQEDFWAQLSPREKVAVYVGNLNYQVCNGGISQWICNGYAACVDELLPILSSLGENGRKVAQIVTNALKEEEDHEDWDEYEDGEWDYSEDWDRQFYTVNEAMLQECEALVSHSDVDFDERMSGESPRPIPTVKPIVKGPVSDNIFAIMGACQKALVKAGQDDKSKELVSRVRQSSGYDQALGICIEYVEFAL